MDHLITVRRIVVRCSVAVKVPNLVSHTRQTPPPRGKGSRYGHGYEYPTPYPYPPNPSAKNRGVTRTRAFPYMAHFKFNRSQSLSTSCPQDLGSIEFNTTA